MKVNFKVSFYLRSNYETHEGKAPIMVRIFLDGEMLDLGSSGLSVDKKVWNTPTNRAMGRSADVLNLNTNLDMISSSLQNIFRDMQHDEIISLDRIKSIYLGKDKKVSTFIPFFNKYLENVKAEVGVEKSKVLYQKYIIS